MQLLAMGRQQSALGHVRSHTYDVPTDNVHSRGTSTPTRRSQSDTALVQDIEREKTSLLDTPAPRKMRPVPTVFEPVFGQPASAVPQKMPG